MKSSGDTHRRLVAGVLGLALASTGIQSARAASDTSGPQRGSAQAMVAVIGDAACDNDSQCKTVAMGAKACGGPEYYLAWSTKRTSAAALRQAGEQELMVARNPHVDPGMRSTCVFVADPGAYCAAAAGQARDAARTQGGFCKLRGADRGGGRVD
jgi:hypothetical protein